MKFIFALLFVFSLSCSSGGGPSSTSGGIVGGDGAPPENSSGNNDDGYTLSSGGPVSVPLLIQEAIPYGYTGSNRSGAVATFGIPFANSDEVGLINGRPALAVQNANAYQFRTLATWPDGYVKWALVDAQTDVTAGVINSSLSIVDGTGRSSVDDLAFDDGSLITIQTGGLVAQISKSDFNLFQQVWVDGVVIVPVGQSQGIVGSGVDGSTISVKPGSTSVSIEENGPARAVVRADGTLRTSAGFDVLDFTCRIVARAGSKDLQVDFTARNANIDRPQHVAIDGLNLVVRAQTGANPVATLSRHDGKEMSALAANDLIYLHQAQSLASIKGGEDVMGGQYGYEIVKNGTSLWPLGDVSKSPVYGYADLTGANGGITLGYKHMAYWSPASLELTGAGDVVAGLFSSRHAAGKKWTFTWRQHMSRSVVFSFHQGAGPSDLSKITKSLDVPVAGRAADYLQYDRAGVLPYRLVTTAQTNAAFAAMGINYTIATHNEGFLVTRYLYAPEGGGANNHDSIEKNLGGEWLRHGFGGQYLTGLDLALYKSEWQIERSDNFLDKNDPGASNPSLPHASGFQGDYEHRYRDGIVLAYWLSGDERFRDALFDEAEILNHIYSYFYPQERGMVQTFRAIARVGEFTGDADGKLKANLKSLLNTYGNKLVDINVPNTNGWGWEAAPDAGARRYFVCNVGSNDPLPPGDNYASRGFMTGSLAPLGMYHAARWLGLSDPQGALARGRMRDLAFYAKNELYPYKANPADRWLAYVYGLNTMVTWVKENEDFHPLMLGWGEAYLDTNDASFLQRGVEQMQGFATHDNSSYSTNNLYTIECRLDVQHFLRIYLDSLDP